MHFGGAMFFTNDSMSAMELARERHLQMRSEALVNRVDLARRY